MARGQGEQSGGGKLSDFMGPDDSRQTPEELAAAQAAATEAEAKAKKEAKRARRAAKRAAIARDIAEAAVSKIEDLRSGQGASETSTSRTPAGPAVSTPQPGGLDLDALLKPSQESGTSSGQVHTWGQALEPDTFSPVGPRLEDLTGSHAAFVTKSHPVYSAPGQDSPEVADSEGSSITSGPVPPAYASTPVVPASSVEGSSDDPGAFPDSHLPRSVGVPPPYVPPGVRPADEEFTPLPDTFMDEYTPPAPNAVAAEEESSELDDKADHVKRPDYVAQMDEDYEKDPVHFMASAEDLAASPEEAAEAAQASKVMLLNGELLGTRPGDRALGYAARASDKTSRAADHLTSVIANPQFVEKRFKLDAMKDKYHEFRMLELDNSERGIPFYSRYRRRHYVGLLRALEAREITEPDHLEKEFGPLFSLKDMKRYVARRKRRRYLKIAAVLAVAKMTLLPDLTLAQQDHAEASGKDKVEAVSPQESAKGQKPADAASKKATAKENVPTTEKPAPTTVATTEKPAPTTVAPKPKPKAEPDADFDQKHFGEVVTKKVPRDSTDAELKLVLTDMRNKYLDSWNYETVRAYNGDLNERPGTGDVEFGFKHCPPNGVPINKGAQISDIAEQNDVTIAELDKLNGGQVQKIAGFCVRVSR